MVWETDIEWLWRDDQTESQDFDIMDLIYNIITKEFVSAKRSRFTQTITILSPDLLLQFAKTGAGIASMKSDRLRVQPMDQYNPNRGQ